MADKDRYHPDGSGRLRGESPAAFKKRQREEAQEKEWLDEAAARESLRVKQESCSHYSCQPTEWHWSGAIREMYCPDCELREYREEPNA